MSDGDNATPGHHRTPDETANQWLTRRPPQHIGAAPWERGGISAAGPRPGLHPDGPADEPSAHESEEPQQATGSHGADSHGVTVADLIAKVGHRPRGRRSRHRAEPAEPEEVPADAGWREAATISIPTAYASELAQFPSVSDDRETTVLPAVTDESQTHIGEPADLAGPEREKRNHRPVMYAGRIAAALIAVLALTMTGAAWQWQASKNNLFNTISALDLNSRDIKDPNAQYGDENFLIVGVDSRAGANSDMGAGDTDETGGARSDTVMLVNIPASRKRVVAVSFPRDLAIKPLQCQPWNAQTGTYGPVYDDKTGTNGPDQVYTETKLNSAYSIGGPKCLVKEIQKLSGLSINRFMAIDFTGFAKMVDVLGGVEVCSSTPLEDSELGTVLEKAGRQNIDGRTALNYVRARSVSTETNGDYGRIKRQQLFLSSLLRALISREVFFSMSKLNNVVNAFIADSYVDNITTKDLVDLGQSLQGITAGHITFVTVPTGETDADGNEPLRAADNRALFDAIINDDPLPGENNSNATTTPTTPSRTSTTQASSSPTSQAPQPANDGNKAAETVNAVATEPQTVTVHVSDSTGHDGLATTAADELQKHGFKVLHADDYPSALPATTVFYSPGNEQAAATVASSFANSQIERVTGMGNTVQVVLGPDFNTVGPPAPSGSPVSVHITHTTSSTPTRLPDDLSVTNGADTTCE